MQPDEPIEHELLRNAVAAEVTVTNTEVISTSTGDRYVRIEGRLGDDENSHAEWAAVGFIPEAFGFQAPHATLAWPALLIV